MLFIVSLPNLFIDIIILLLSLLCTAFIFRIWQKVKGKGRMVLTVGFAYGSLVRGLVVVRDITGANIPTSQLTFFFWLLLALGLGILLKEIKQTLRSRG